MSGGMHLACCRDDIEPLGHPKPWRFTFRRLKQFNADN
jgi:hypothetical protein